MTVLVVALAVAAASFALSSSAGLGGSLLLVPALSLLLGPKEGVVLATVLLGLNNVAKVAVYRQAVPWRSVAAVLTLTVVGAAVGARLLVLAPERWVTAAVIASVVVSFLTERRGAARLQRAAAPWLALGAGTTSGFSGTSGPLKGLALRSLGLDRLRLVGAASVVSLAGDAAKAAVFLASPLGAEIDLTLVLAAVPLMPLAALAGRALNGRLGERAFTYLFWTVMTGYSLRLVLLAAVR